MNRQHAPRLNGVQHPLRAILRGIAQVEVHAEARGGLGLRGEGVEKLLGKNHLGFGQILLKRLSGHANRA